MSKDILLAKDNNSIWQTSQIQLPDFIFNCNCLITQQSTLKPKLIILSPGDKNFDSQNKCLTYNLCDIVGYHTFVRFTQDLTTVKKN